MSDQAVKTETPPALRVLSLGAGVQSTTLALMGVYGDLPKPDAAVFADTGWEPRTVYEQLDRLEQALDEASIPLYRVERTNLRDATLDESRRITIPVFVATRNGGSAPASIRECTRDFKLRPITRKVRELLGYPGRKRVPHDVYAEQWIGFSTDEIRRATGKSDARFLKPRYPLLELGMDRQDCQTWLAEHGWEGVAKSACIGCPFHGNSAWRELRDTCFTCRHHRNDHLGSSVGQPCSTCACDGFDDTEWRDAVEFDREIRRRDRGFLKNEPYLHRSLTPLDQAPINEQPKRRLQGFDLAEDGDPDGCSPFGCRSGEPVR